MGYTSEQIKWCDENESYMWRYFIEKELLYSVDQKLIPRFINMVFFSKFYLEIDNETLVGGSLDRMANCSRLWKTMRYLCNSY
jgi:hypothetical protein